MEIRLIFNFGGHKSCLWGHWYPCFGLLLTSALGFKVRVDPLAYMQCRLCAMDSRDSPLVRHLLTADLRHFLYPVKLGKFVNQIEIQQISLLFFSPEISLYSSHEILIMKPCSCNRS